MPDEVKYYAMMLTGDTLSNPSGLARRRVFDDGGISDEAFKRDQSWGHTPLLAAAERGDMTFEVVEISEEEADRIMEGFRVQWASED